MCPPQMDNERMRIKKKLQSQNSSILTPIYDSFQIPMEHGETNVRVMSVCLRP